MARTQRELAGTETTPYYHHIRRCVRRASLRGNDHFTGSRYAHRKIWALERLEKTLRPDAAVHIPINHVDLNPGCSSVTEMPDTAAFSSEQRHVYRVRQRFRPVFRR